MKKRAKRAKTRNRSLQTRKPEVQKLPFIEHLYELRKRLFYVAVSVGVFSLIAYSFERTIIKWLLKPAGGQHFIYTSPIGGLDFLFRVCLYIGIAASIPIIVYQFLRYIEPLLKQSSVRFITTGSIASGILALSGISFGYFVGLPAALHFLLHQFVTKQIQPLITIQSYMAFVSVYMFGSALLFQIPLILIFINRIKPLNPKKLISLKYQRWVILGAFIGGGIMNPNPNLLDQVVIVGPLIVMYEVGVGIIWLGQRRHRKPSFMVDLLKHDSELQAVRRERFVAARQVLQQQLANTQTQKQPITTPATTGLRAAAVAQIPEQIRPVANIRTATRPVRPVARRKYINDFGPNRPYANLSQRVSPGAA
jgi:sec-independent protein translocase protein TatC